MKVRINKEDCIACGVCADIAPEVFTMGDDAAEVVNEDVPPEHEEAVREAAESCPTEAIVVEE
jgi:ferredoxin